MNPLAKKITTIPVSATLAMTQKSRELKAAGKDIINLSIGEPDFDTPSAIKQAAKLALDENYTHYPPVAGFADLRKAIAEKLQHQNGINAKASNIVVSTGAKQAIINVLFSLLNPGDEVLLPAPYWVSYPQMVQMADGIPVSALASIDNNFKLTPTELTQAITSKTKLIIFSNPANPTGAVYTQQDIEGWIEVLKQHPQVMIVSDEIYELINYPNQQVSLGSYNSIAERVITINGFSKGFAMTGWRLGYACAPEWLAKACEKVQGQMTSGACSISQRAALAALTLPQTEIDTLCNHYLNRRDIMLDGLAKISGLKTPTPQGAFYIFSDVTHYFGKPLPHGVIHNANELSLYLLEHAGVATVPGDAFGDPNCIRLSYATDEETIKIAITKITNALIG